MVETYGAQPRVAHAAAVSYLKLWGIVTGGWQLARGALAASRHLAAGTGDANFLHAKVVTAQFYMANILPQAQSLARTVTEGAGTVLELAAEQF